MKVGILLLSEDGFYAGVTNQLPQRPYFDKELLISLCQGQRAVVGPNTRQALPKSISEQITEVPWEDDYDINLGIVPLKVNPPHLLIVVRSARKLFNGKHFSLSEYSNVFSSRALELYIYKDPN